MDKDDDMAGYLARLSTEHIKKCLASYKGKSPMIVGMQGPQGSGKTTACEKIKARLEGDGCKVAVFSLDDLYQTHDDLEHLAKTNPTNALLNGRGQPGTHDMSLGARIFKQLKEAEAGSTISLPTYDKSKHNGKGDRGESTVDVVAPLQVVIFEGWCLGFYPITEVDLQKRWHEGRLERGEEEVWRDNSLGNEPYFHRHTLKSLLQVNTLLGGYLEWYEQIDAFIQLKPDNLQNVFAWRLQAEHAMKKAGKDGMTDEQVHDFVARYMPGYELFGEGVTRNDTHWSGKGLQVSLDADREVLDVASF